MNMIRMKSDMKIAITASSPDLDTEVDPRFGRAVYFVIVDEEGGEWEAYPNPAFDSRGGAGVHAARFIAEKKAGVVVSGSFGPNAYETLTAADIEMLVFPAGEVLTVREVLNLYREGRLAEVSSSLSSGHHGQ